MGLENKYLLIVRDCAGKTMVYSKKEYSRSYFERLSHEKHSRPYKSQVNTMINTIGSGLGLYQYGTSSQETWILTFSDQSPMEQAQAWNKLEIENCINKIKSGMSSRDKSQMTISALPLLKAVRMQNKTKEKRKILKQNKLRRPDNSLGQNSLRLKKSFNEYIKKNKLVLDL